MQGRLERIPELRERLFDWLSDELISVARSARPVDLLRLVQEQLRIKLFATARVRPMAPVPTGLLVRDYGGDFARAGWDAQNDPFIEIDDRLNPDIRNHYLGHEIAHLLTGTFCNPTDERDEEVEEACFAFAAALIDCPTYWMLVAHQGFRLDAFLSMTAHNDLIALQKLVRWLRPRPYAYFVFSRLTYPTPFFFGVGNDADRSIFGLPSGKPWKGWTAGSGDRCCFAQGGELCEVDDIELLKALSGLSIDRRPLLHNVYRSLHRRKFEGSVRPGTLNLSHHSEIEVTILDEPYHSVVGPIGRRRHRHTLLLLIVDDSSEVLRTSQQGGCFFLPPSCFPSWAVQPVSPFDPRPLVAMWANELFTTLIEIDERTGKTFDTFAPSDD